MLSIKSLMFVLLYCSNAMQAQKAISDEEEILFNDL